jgi:2-methylcitrate dehydratase PrpD
MTSSALTEYVADFTVQTSLKDIPPDAIHLAKRSILDGLGLATAGSKSGAAIIARRVLTTDDCGDQCTILGTGSRTSPRTAALLNGIAIHADDFDDTQLAKSSSRVYGLLTHPTAPVLPAVLSIAERDGRGGKEALLAYLVGVEVETKAAEAIDPRHYGDGFHSTGTLGTLGSACAVARLLELSEDDTRTCLGIAASQAAGLRENFGTMTKPFHAGRAAQNGLLAAELAAAGFSAAANILEADRGFFSAAGGGFQPDLVMGQLGRPWTFLEPGISIKPYPSGSLTHPGMNAVLDLIERHDIDPKNVERVFVRTNRYMPNALIHHRPTTELQAKFSMEFCIAILLLDRQAGLAEFTDEVVQRPDVQQMIERISFEPDPDVDAAGFDKMTTLIDVQLRDGSRLSARADFAKGSPQHPMSDAELIGKFTECVEWAGVTSANASSVAGRMMELEKQTDIRTVLDPLRAGLHGE